MSAPQNDLAQLAAAWALTNGVIVTNKSGNVNHAPFTLYPFEFPANEFKKAYEIQSLINKVQYKLSFDQDFLNNTLSEASKSDEFTGRLLKIYNDVCAKKINKGGLAIIRSDYMLDGDKTIKQVEVNTIAASFGSLGTKMCHLHRFLDERYNGGKNSSNLPENNALSGIVSGIAHAHMQYLKPRDDDPNVVVMMVVLPNENNSFDQNWLEYTLFNQHKITLIRRSLNDLGQRASVTDGGLFIDGYEISVSYFRAGYSPDHYLSETEWEGRIKIEMSQSISCPSVGYQLTGTKKVQQSLADINVLSRYLDSKEDVSKLHSTFTGLYATDDKSVSFALSKPLAYVLKPQREGGGNNLYEADMVEALNTMSMEERSQYILMDRIVPEPREGFIVRDSKIISTTLICELGVFGYLLSFGQEINEDKTCGHLLRSKPSNENDGGVAAGVAVLDSPKCIS